MSNTVPLLVRRIKLILIKMKTSMTFANNVAWKSNNMSYQTQKIVCDLSRRRINLFTSVFEKYYLDCSKCQPNGKSVTHFLPFLNDRRLQINFFYERFHIKLENTKWKNMLQLHKLRWTSKPPITISSITFSNHNLWLLSGIG